MGRTDCRRPGAKAPWWCVYSCDVTLAGIQRIAQILPREGLLEPLKPLLVLSEVLDGAKWKRRSLWFIESGAALKIDDLSSLALTQA